MPPFSDQNQANTDLDLPLLIECSNNTGMSSCTIVFIFFILVFYALALWDRWLNLKLRESQKLRSNTPPCQYGATQESSVGIPSLTLTAATPSAPNTIFSDGKAPRNQKDKKSPKHLAPPPIVLDESPILGAANL